jgi:hypothetical protein
MPEIKQYGLQRSGTNFLRIILQENYCVSVHPNVGGWKHGFYECSRRLGRELDCAICVKDPYAWVSSFYNFRHPAREIPFADFVRGQLTVSGGPDNPPTTITSPNPIRHWVRMNEHWLAFELMTRRKFLFRYEEVLADPFGKIQNLVKCLGLQRRRPFLRRVAKFLGLSANGPGLFLPKVRLGAVRDRYKGKEFKRGRDFDPKRYTERRYLDAFTPELLEFVNEHLNPNLLCRLGYEMLEPKTLVPC